MAGLDIMRFPLELCEMVYEEYVLDIGNTYNLKTDAQVFVIRCCLPLHSVSKAIGFEHEAVVKRLITSNAKLMHRLNILSPQEIDSVWLCRYLPVQNIEKCEVHIDMARVVYGPDHNAYGFFGSPDGIGLRRLLRGFPNLTELHVEIVNDTKNSWCILLTFERYTYYLIYLRS
jgi:hypothetical protein